MIEYEEWYYSTDVHEGTMTFYNYFFSLPGDGVGMLSIEDIGGGAFGVVQYNEGTYEEMEEDIIDNYELELVDVKELEHIFIKKAFG